MKWFRNMGLVLKSSLIMAIFIIIVVSIMVLENSAQDKSTYFEHLRDSGRLMEKQFIPEETGMSSVYEKMKKGQPFTTSRSYQKLSEITELLSKEDNVSHAYVLVPGVQGGAMTYMLSSDSDDEQGPKAGDAFTAPEQFMNNWEKAQKDGSVVYEAELENGENWLTYLQPIKNSKGDTMAVFQLDFDPSHMQEQLNTMLKREAVIAISTEVIGILLIVLLLRAMLAPLKRLARLSEQAASGDLTVSADVRAGGEIGRLSTAFNGMIANLNGLIHKVQTLSQTVNNNAESVHHNASDSSSQTRIVADSVREVAAGSSQQLQSSQESQRAMTEITIGIHRIAESASQVADLAAVTSEKATSGGERIDSTVAQMNAIEERLVQAASEVQELQAGNRNIREAMDLISDIATQTHLLALNASIEAARAGEQGKGFAVVAQEIRKLAERAGESSQQVSDMLGSIVLRTNAMAHSVTNSLQEAQEGMVIAAQAGESFRHIEEGIRTLVSQMQEVSASTEEMSAGSEQIAASLDELERIAERAADQASSASSAAERQLALMEEVEGASESMKSAAGELTSAVQSFKV
ncbi:methyl-accepting chemotaxis protein [Paenibacillus cellulosilyticus]|uniref:Methyl-accepting chemotaxis protein n=1 Tax=Paenibacillus cellulosilyticus TaxID=375489 RepID=A0A2V2YZB1_9BACL|nr:methyl-accepting chemotaxis protein [Paenibacillus cellulosilyticus]PWW08439.1 methyl-accepting chemotaxis protein [Paenibacillus cellulosilyticus]QKS48027.1 methyl-accepting chemotaxis protein [Paenibacillus cellulosilyticus]